MLQCASPNLCSFVACADMRSFDGSAAAVAAASTAYVQGPCSQTRWDSWGTLVEPLAANCPLMVLPGNHEVEQDGAPPATQTEFMAYQARMVGPVHICPHTHERMLTGCAAAAARPSSTSVLYSLPESSREGLHAACCRVSSDACADTRARTLLVDGVTGICL